jgi:succinate dehydrogenase / fumarate reductase membrane anchor subunit
MVNRVIVGAHYGFGSWLAQRVTAAAMAVYTVLLAVILLVTQPGDFDTWRSVFDPMWMRLATEVFWLSLFYHAWIGVRDIIMDYIKPVWLRLVAHSVVILVLVAMAAWSVQILWRT